jgi:hypothetical protein
MSGKERHVLLFFLDGVGLGSTDPDSNPLAAAQMPHLGALLGAGWYAARERIVTKRATLVPTDATLGVAGRPQSATGQATIVTGRNMPQLFGRHIGPWPTRDLRAELQRGNLFADIRASGGTTALLNPYPQSYFDQIASGRRSYSVIPFAASSAGQMLFREAELRAGQAVSPGFTNEGWRDQLGIDDIPILSPPEAGARLAQVSRHYTFCFLEHWLTDVRGHRGTLMEAVELLEMIDSVIGGLLANWDDASGLLMITSDHGNIEEKLHRNHTRNPVPTILVGEGHQELGGQIRDLADLAGVITSFV